MSRGYFDTADTIGTKLIARPARTMGDLDYNDPAVIDALNSGISPATIQAMQGAGVTDVTLETQALASGIVNETGPSGYLLNASLISGIPNWALLAVAGVFIAEMVHWNK